MSISVSSHPPAGQKLDQMLGEIMEGLLFALVIFSPWAFGCAEPTCEFILNVGVGGLVILWALRLIVQGRFVWTWCPLTLCLAGFLVLGLVQIVSLPSNVLESISPATSEMYGRLFPTETEESFSEEEQIQPLEAKGTTLSFYPEITRREIFRLLAVFLLFVVVRQNFATFAALRRLSWVVLVNGTLLALFALVQFFSTPGHSVYWIFPSQGAVFGPFICRNHFAFYINICFGLGLGLLLQKSFSSSLKKGKRTIQNHVPLDLRNILHQPMALWIVGALVLMLSSTVFCLSRGGFLAFIAALAFCIIIGFRRFLNFSSLTMILIVPTLAFGMLLWFGLDPVVSRLSSIWESKDNQGERWPMWQRTLTLAPDFALWGTGYGTFPFVEPLRSTDPTVENLSYLNAHNEYLEALIEGGVVRLFLTLLAVSLTFRLGYQAFRRFENQQTGFLILGALFAFFTVALHSFLDFGLHIPAITLLVTVFCAQMIALRTSPSEGSSANVAPRQLVIKGRLAPALLLLAALGSSLMLVGERWKNAQVDRLFVNASKAKKATNSIAQQQGIAHLEAAVQLVPNGAFIRVELAKVHYLLYEEKIERLTKMQNVMNAVQEITAWTSTFPGDVNPLPELTSQLSISLGTFTNAALISPREQMVAEKHLMPALRHFVRARDLCPLWPDSHVGIAAHADRLKKADSSLEYLERALFLAPSSPRLLFLGGSKHLTEGEEALAWKYWRRSLELSNEHFVNIMELAPERLDAHGILDKIMPERPEIILAAANQLFPEVEKEKRRPFAEKAIALWAKKTMSGQDYFLLGETHNSLGNIPEAQAAFQAALDIDPQRLDWRFALSRCLAEQRKWTEAKRELQIVLGQQPAHPPAKSLLHEVTLKIAQNR